MHPLLAALLLTVAAPEPPVIFHATFDGTTEADAVGQTKPVSVEGPVAYRPGKLGQALLCGEGGAAVEYSTAGNLRATAGTIAMWVSPVDWTGDEDQFHVWIEAKDPGWLVLYRYYQGGLTMLTGSDGGHYRAAGSPRIKWQPGSWHHIAGTWRARQLVTYIDGLRTGTASAPILPEKLAETFLVGDLPWHVERTKQTLVDDVTVFSVPLDEASIAKLAKGEAIDYQPQILVGLQAHPDRDVLQVDCDAAGLVGEYGVGRAASVALLPKGGGPPLDKAAITGFPQDQGTAELQMKDVPTGEYEVWTVLTDADGGEICRDITPFTKPGPPVWRGNKIGQDDEVLPPFTPLQVDRQANTVDCWNRRYTFGPVLRQVTSGGAALLEQPVTIEAVRDGKPVALAGPAPKITAATETKAALDGQLAGAGLTAKTAQSIEFDGFTWTDLTITAPQPVDVDELRLTWTLPTSQATLFHVDQRKWRNNPAGSIPAEGWSAPFTHFLWTGNETGGLCWYAESDQFWEADADRPALSIVPEGDAVRVTVRLIAKPTTLDGSRTYGFGLMATPSRPRPADARHWRLTPAPRPTFDIVWPNNNLTHYGYTIPIDPAGFKQRVSDGHAKGMLTIPYINLNYVSDGVPEWKYYGDGWSDHVRATTPSDVAAMGYASMGTCPAMIHWQDFILFRINEMLDQYQVDGIYIDCWGPYPCTAEPCGWSDAAGKRHGTHPIRGYREILRRVYALFREKRPDARLMIHMSSQVDAPLLSFTDTILDGEQFRDGTLAADYLDVLPPDAFRAEFMGLNHGPVDFFLPELREPNLTTGTTNLAPYLLLHDVQPWPIWSDNSIWRKLYDGLDAVGWVDAEFHPYWLDSGVTAPDGVLVSRYVTPQATVLAVVNTGEATTAKLGLDGVSSGVDLLSDETFAAADGQLTVPLARHQGRVIRLD